MSNTVLHLKGHPLRRPGALALSLCEPKRERTLPRAPILAHGEGEWRSFWCYRFLTSPALTISRTRSSNAQSRGERCAHSCSTGRLERMRHTYPSPPRNTKEGRRRNGVSGTPTPKLMPDFIIPG